MIPKTTETDEDFIKNYQRQSRLSFIGTWSHRYHKLKERLSKQIPIKLTKSELLDRSRIILHVDLDCFFVQASLKEHRPDLIEEEGSKAMVVMHGNGDNGEVSCANYEARKLGIRANHHFNSSDRKRPKDLIVLPYAFEAYMASAEHLYETLFTLTDYVIGSSCDEAYIDCTNGLKLSEEDIIAHGGSLEKMRSKDSYVRGNALTEFVQRYVQEMVGLKCSVGASTNRLVAKIATSRFAKPNGSFPNKWYYVCPKDLIEFMKPLSVSDIPGVGGVKVGKLNEIGINICEDLQDIKIPSRRFDDLSNSIGGSGDTSLKLIQNARGCDDSVWEPDLPPQSTSIKISWGVRFETSERVFAILKDMCDVVSSRAKELGNRMATVVVLEIMRKSKAYTERPGFLGHGPCTTHTKQKELVNPSNKVDEIFKVVRNILCEFEGSITAIDAIRGLCVKLQFEHSRNNAGSPLGKRKGPPLLKTDSRGVARGNIGPQNFRSAVDKLQPKIDAHFFQAVNGKRNSPRAANVNTFENRAEEQQEDICPPIIEEEFKKVQLTFKNLSRSTQIEMHSITDEDYCFELARDCASRISRELVLSIERLYKREMLYIDDIQDFVVRCKRLTSAHEQLLDAFKSNAVCEFIKSWHITCDEILARHI